MAKEPEFNGTESKVVVPYGVLTGDVAKRVNKALLEAKVEGSDLTLIDAGFALKGKFGVNSADELWGSTPDMRMVLEYYVPTEDFGFSPATPQQIARVYNEDSEFIRGKMWLDSQMIRNGFATSSNGAWADRLNEEIRQAGFRDNQVLAVPYSAVKPVMIQVANGHLSNSQVAGYKLVDGASDLIKVLDWNVNAVKGFKFGSFDEKAGVPEIGSGKDRQFYGLTNNIFSALVVDGGLNAGGGRGFDYSGDGARVVCWRTGEASSC